MTTSIKIKETKICKCGEEYEVRRYNGLPVSKYCPKCTRDRKYAKTKAAQQRRREKQKSSSIKPKSYAQTPKQNARDRADAYFAKYIKLLYADSQGRVQCYTHTPSKTLRTSEVDLGHYISRKVLSVRYDVRNGRPQCVYCNRGNYGESETFRKRLIKEIGEEEVLSLENKAKEYQDDTIEFYNEMSDKFRVLYNNLKKQRGV